MNLNGPGYEHYAVIHKSYLKQVYQNVYDRENVQRHTNQIEDAWKHFKGHFKRINATKTCCVEAYLTEMVWRNHVQN